MVPTALGIKFQVVPPTLNTKRISSMALASGFRGGSRAGGGGGAVKAESYDSLS